MRRDGVGNRYNPTRFDVDLTCHAPANAGATSACAVAPSSACAGIPGYGGILLTVGGYQSFAYWRSGLVGFPRKLLRLSQQPLSSADARHGWSTEPRGQIDMAQLEERAAKSRIGMTAKEQVIELAQVVRNDRERDSEVCYFAQTQTISNI